jgi:hypothetical protein
MPWMSEQLPWVPGYTQPTISPDAPRWLVNVLRYSYKAPVISTGRRMSSNARFYMKYLKGPGPLAGVPAPIKAARYMGPPVVLPPSPIIRAYRISRFSGKLTFN